MPTVVLAVPGAHCSVCRRVILNALQGVPGVHGATLDLRSKQATVTVASTVDADTLCGHLRQAGYDATPVPRGHIDSTGPQGAPNAGR